MQELIYRMYRAFIADNNREPKIICMSPRDAKHLENELRSHGCHTLNMIYGAKIIRSIDIEENKIEIH